MSLTAQADVQCPQGREEDKHRGQPFHGRNEGTGSTFRLLVMPERYENLIQKSIDRHGVENKMLKEITRWQANKKLLPS